MRLFLRSGTLTLTLIFVHAKVDVRAAFSPFGEIVSVDMSYEPLTGKTKGYCFIEYRRTSNPEP